MKKYLSIVAIAFMIAASCSENPLLATVEERVALANETGTVEAPVADKAPGLYFSDQSVTLSTQTVGASIYYTLDGSTPTTSTLKYAAPIPISGDGTSATIKAIAVKAGMTDSTLASLSYSVAYSTGIPSASASLTDTTPFFDWSDAAEAAEYRFQLARDPSFEDILIDEDGLPVSQYLVANRLDNELDYWWRVAAYQNGAWSPFSVPRRFSMEFGRISGFSPSDGSWITNPSPVLGWTDAVNSQGYVLQLSADQDFTSPQALDVAASSYEIVDPLNEESPYEDVVWYWRVRAKSEDGVTMGAWSATQSLTIKFFNVGDDGPAGGKVFYDKGEYSDGWRYMESAPSDYPSLRYWGPNYVKVSGTGPEIGAGKSNTDQIVAAYGVGTYAASICHSLVIGEFDDWFLPSIDELDAMYNYAGVGAGVPDFYWTSTEDSDGLTFVWAYANYRDMSGPELKLRSESLIVRAARRF